MRKYVITGGRELHGEVTLSGGKNAAVGVIPAAVLVNGIAIIENVPQIDDVEVLIQILEKMGAKIDYLDTSCLRIDATGINVDYADYDLCRKLRASYYLIGALLGRCNSAKVGLPGGCDFGSRPIDYHIRGFESLGAEVSIEHGIVNAHAENLKGTNIYLDFPSVGATVNIMLAACKAEGQTIIENAAKEPHIVDIANFLNAMGAEIRGAGTDVIKIRGVKEMTGGRYEIIPDQIEAGTFMAMATATGGEVTVRNIIPKHLESISTKLEEIGATIIEHDDYLIISRNKPVHRANVKTLPYPGFPTDMQPQISTVLTIGEGTSVVTETIYDHRFKYVDELRRMGAQMKVDGNICIIEGVSHLTGASVRACDLRAGVALIIAGLCAEGITEITNVELIERGYMNIVDKLKSLGADIQIVDDNVQSENEIEKIS